MTSLAKRALKYWLPEIKSAAEFGDLIAGLKANFSFWQLFFDMNIAEETVDAFKINVRHCPICVVLNFTGLSDMSPYFCNGDWAKAEENKDKWTFERDHQIGTGDSFCDHTYKRNCKNKSGVLR